MEGEIATILWDIDLAHYKDFIYMDIRSIKCIYEESKKVIYFTLEASLLFWTKLSKSLDKIGYHRKKCDCCMMKKNVKVKQYTILWHVNYLKISHVDSNIVPIVLSGIDT